MKVGKDEGRELWCCDKCGALNRERRLFRYGLNDLCAKCIEKVDEDALKNIAEEYGEQWCEDNFEEVGKDVY